MSRTNQVLRLLLAAAGASLIACAKDDSAPSMIGGPNGLSNASVPEFDILTTANDDRGFGAATDGSSIMAAFTTGNLGPGNAFGIVRTYVISANGTLGQQTSTGRVGLTPMVAFDGTNYLLAWSDFNSAPLGPSNIFGQFVDPSGQKVGDVFRISTEGQVVILAGLAYANGHYLVTYLRFNTGPGIVGLYGRFVSPAGVPDARFLITNPAATGALNNVATDGTNFLVVWNSGANFESVKARLVDGTSGALGQVATLNSSPAPSSQSVSVAFSGNNYMVTWSDSIDLHESNVYGRLVDQSGLATGGRISIAGGPGQQLGGLVSVINGNFLSTWLDLQPDPANSTVKGRFFSSDGTALGTIHTYFTTDPATGKLPIAAGPIGVGTDAFYLIGRALPGPDPQTGTDLTEWDLHGAIRALTP